MEPLPEVRASIDRLSVLLGGGMDVGAYFNAVAKVAQALVPSCVGVSVTVIVDGEPYTLTATSGPAIDLDMAQYVDQDGPCLEALDGEPVEIEDILDEDRWHAFRQTAAAVNVRSSLSFPLRDVDDQVRGGLNLYSSDPRAFDGNRRLFEVGFGVDVGEAIANADLSFLTRDLARDLPRRLDVREKIDRAVAALVQLHGWSVEQAEEQLTRAARQARTPVEAAADVVLALAGMGDLSH